MSFNRHETQALPDDAAIDAQQMSTVQRIERCLGGIAHVGLDIGRGTLNLGAYAAGGVIGTVQEVRQAYTNGLGRKGYSNTKA